MAQRRLAAIMFTDIVGYDSLLKEDEKKAFEILRKNQRIHRRLMKKFNGRWLKDMESGMLASFSSIIDAVMCALSIRKATTELNIPIRIGLHQGEVIFEKKDVLGDGVNIASRIQNLGKSKEIVISERVYEDIKNKEGLEVEFLGEQALKGVNKPVSIYKVSCTDESVLDFTIDTGELVRPLRFGRSTIVAGIILIALLAYAVYYFLPKTDSMNEFKKSLLIMPFENYLGTDTLDYFVAGMHDQLIGQMGRIGALRVIPKTTSRAYNNSDKSIPEIAKDLDINAVIEPTVLCTGDSICLEIKLLDVDKEEEIWVKEYHEETSQILKLWNNIIKEISIEIDVKLRPQEEIMLTEYHNVDPDALDAYFRGYYYWDFLLPDSTKKAMKYFQQAIDIDPDWADPYAGLATAWSTASEKSFGWLPESTTLPRVYNNMNKALELDPNSASAQLTKAIIATWTEFDWEKAETAFRRSLELNPSEARCRSYYAHLLMILRRDEESVNQARLAVELDPENPLILELCGVVMYNAEEYQSNISLGEKARSIDPRYRLDYTLVRNSYYFLGNYDKWIELWLEQVCWDEELKAILKETYYDQGHIATINELLRLHKQYETDSCWMHPSGFYHWYLLLQDYDRANVYIEKELDDMERLVEQSYWEMAYLGINSNYEIFKDNPRYIALLKKMNLPVD